MKMICGGCGLILESANRPHDLKDHLVQIVAEDAYKRDVLDTEMEEILIGEGNEFADKEDWMDSWLRGMIDWYFCVKEGLWQNK